MARSYKWLLDQGIRPDHVALIGDSAGGGLAVTTILRAREQGLPMPAATMPLSPWLDMEATGETFETQRREGPPGVRATSSRRWPGRFSAKAAIRRTRWPTRSMPTCRGLPPIYIQVGADETLLDDSRRLADLTRRKSGVDVTLEIVPEMQHVFQFLAGTAPEADDAIKKLAHWVRPKLGLGR